MVGQVSGGRCWMCNFLTYLPPEATQKHAACVTWNFLQLCWDNNKLQSRRQKSGNCVSTAPTSRPFFCLHVFSECTSVYVLVEEDSRAELSDILWGSVNVGGAQRERGWRGWGGDNGSRCHEDSGIVGDLFCCWVFLFPSSSPNVLRVQKRKRVDIQHWCGEARRWWNAKHGCHLSALVFMCLCVHPWVAGKPSRLHQVKDKLAHGPRSSPTYARYPRVLQFTTRFLRNGHNVLKFLNSKVPELWTWMDRIDSHLVLNLVGKSWCGQDSCETAGAEMFVGVLSPVLEAPLKCQLSVWERDNLADQSGISSFIIHREPIQSLAAQGHRTLSSMPPLIIRPHQRLFGLSNQCLFNSRPSLQETTNEYFISPPIQS